MLDKEVERGRGKGLVKKKKIAGEITCSRNIPADRLNAHNESHSETTTTKTTSLISKTNQQKITNSRTEKNPTESCIGHQ